MSKGNSYHISIGGQGYMLKGTPESPGRKMERAPVFGNRFASGDRDYTDFSIWWYWAQTDWSGGFKDQKDWADDAKYYYSTNIDAYNKIGAIQLAESLGNPYTFTEDVFCGSEADVNGNTNYYVGTDDNASSEPVVYRYTGGSWVDISSTQMTTNQNVINQITGHKDTLWVITTGNGNSNVVLSWDTSTWTDHSAAIRTAMGWAGSSSARSATIIGDTLYVAVEYSSGDVSGIVKTSDNGATWTKVLEHDTDRSIPATGEYGGDLYYMLSSTSAADLWVYDVSADAYSLVKTFTNINYINWGHGSKFLFNEFGKLIILVPKQGNYGEIYSYDGTTITKIYEADVDKIDIGLEAYAKLNEGGVIKDNKLYCNNLVYDGASFYNNIKPLDDSTSLGDRLCPIFTDQDGDIWWKEADGSTDVWKAAPGNYRSGSDKNFIVFSEFAEVSTIDKLPNAIRIIFEPFDVAEEIEIHYSTDGGSTYTELGSASRTLDGGTVTQKTFLFDGATDFRKLFIKVYLNGDGTSTPVLLDFSLQYLPIPHYNYQWSFNINGNNDIKLLDGRTQEPKKGIDIRNQLRSSFLTKQVVDLQDVDYQETLLNGLLSDSATTVTVDSTDGFPEEGRIKIEQEEISYTGKTSTTFTGCTRGYRGTPAKEHADDTEVSTKYRVIITDFAEENPTLDDDTAIDYTLKVNLIEV